MKKKKIHNSNHTKFSHVTSGLSGQQRKIWLPKQIRLYSRINQKKIKGTRNTRINQYIHSKRIFSNLFSKSTQSSPKVLFDSLTSSASTTVALLLYNSNSQQHIKIYKKALLKLSL